MSEFQNAVHCVTAAHSRRLATVKISDVHAVNDRSLPARRCSVEPNADRGALIIRRELGEIILRLFV